MEATSAPDRPTAAGGEGVGAILSASAVSKIFGGLVAVDDVSFDIPRRSIVSIKSFTPTGTP